jgi:hypothetical protein
VLAEDELVLARRWGDPHAIGASLRVLGLVEGGEAGIGLLGGGRGARRLEAAGGAPTLLWMRCPKDELLRRMDGRAAPRDRAKLADPEKHLTAGVLAPPAVGHTVIDATSSADRQLAQALAALKSPGPAGG